MLPISTSAQGYPRGRLLFWGCLTALGAAAFTIAFFNILTPPRDAAALLNPPTLAAPTPSVSESPALPRVPAPFLEDNFSTRNNWPRVVNDAPYGYMKGGYLLAPPPDAHFTHVFLQNFNNTDSRDLSLEVEAGPLTGSSGVNYGTFFWHSQDSSGIERFLYFGVSTDGKYLLGAWGTNTASGTPSAPGWVNLVPETLSPLIHTDGSPNRVRVDLHPHRIIAFINGSLVFDRDNSDVDAFRDRDDFDGRVGLMAFSLGKPGAKVLYSLFDLYADVNK